MFASTLLFVCQYRVLHTASADACVRVSLAIFAVLNDLPCSPLHPLRQLSLRLSSG